MINPNFYVLNDLLFVSSTSKNLMFVYRFCFDNGLFLEFIFQNVKVRDVTTKEVLMIGLYELPVVINRNSEAMLGKRVTLQLGTSTPKCIR